MIEGYIKLWRKAIDSAVFQDPELWKLWCLCLMKATHKPMWVAVEGSRQPVKIEPGQFVTGRFSLHRDYYPKKKAHQKSAVTIWNWLKILENMQNLSIKTCSKYSLVSITNWDAYQQQPQENLHVNLQPACSGFAAGLHKQEYKEVKTKNPIEHFAAFWASYPRKKNKGQAEKAWKKIKPDAALVEKIMSGLDAAKKSRDWVKDGGEFIPYPATWLNARGWEDEQHDKPAPTRSAWDL